MQTQAEAEARSLSPELCRRIAYHARAGDLPRLAQTNKAFQLASEQRIYRQLNLGVPETAFLCLNTIASSERLGPYVHDLCIYVGDRRWQRHPLPHRYWQAVQLGMKKMRNLEFVYIHDPTGKNTFILNPTELNFQVREAQLLMDLDESMANFLNSQHRVERLQLADEPSQTQLKPGALAHLQQFSGPLSVAAQLMTTRLTHVQIRIEDTSTPASLDHLFVHLSARMPLISLNLLDIPRGHSVNVLQTVSKMWPDLKYIGCLSFPSRERERFHRSLATMHHLRIIEVYATSWEPQPIGAIQKIFAAELYVFCPSLRLIAFWVGDTRSVWALEDDKWIFQSHNPSIEPLWKTV